MHWNTEYKNSEETNVGFKTLDSSVKESLKICWKLKKACLKHLERLNVSDKLQKKWNTFFGGGGHPRHQLSHCLRMVDLDRLAPLPSVCGSLLLPQYLSPQQISACRCRPCSGSEWLASVVGCGTSTPPYSRLQITLHMSMDLREPPLWSDFVGLLAFVALGESPPCMATVGHGQMAWERLLVPKESTPAILFTAPPGCN